MSVFSKHIRPVNAELKRKLWPEKFESETIMNDTIVKVAVLTYDFFLLAGTAYLVTVHNWSMWTFLLAALFFIRTKDSKNEQTT
jgi:hypothetical protein